MSYTEEYAFVMGFWDASLYIATQDGYCPHCSMGGPSGYTNSEIARMLDTFYKTPENAPIPISSALELLYYRLEKRQSAKDEAIHVEAIRQWAGSQPQGDK